MRKLLFRTGTIVAVFMLMVLACQKEQVKENITTENDEDGTSMSVSEAKKWFESNSQPLMTIKAGKINDKKSVTMKPDWNHAFKSQDSRCEIVESQILTLGGFGFATAEALSKYESDKNPGYLNSISRLVVLKYKEDGRIVSFIMTVVPDKNYLEKKKFTLMEGSYLKRDNELSGYVLYHSLDGEFVNGWQYKNGKVIGKVEVVDNKSLTINLKSMMIVTVVVWFEETKTEYWSTSGGGLGTTYYSSQTTTIYSVVYNIEVYYDDQSNTGGGGGSSGGYSPATTPCNCVNMCPVCGGCRDNLKSASIGNCMVCTCPIIVEDPSFINTKADCVKRKLENGSIINNLLGDFNLNASQINLTFKVGVINSSYDGLCEYNLSTRRMDITINTGRLNASGLQLAQTILHESFHAYIYGKLYDSQLHNGLIPEPNFQNDFTAYQIKYGKQAQHNYIADDYIPYMKQALNDYLKNESYIGGFLNIVQNNDNWEGLDFLFECVSWGALKGTDAFASFMADPIKKAKYDKTMDLVKLLPTENCY